MKTNVPIELTDPQRRQLARALDGHRSHRTRLASRKEVTGICQGVIDAMLDEDAPRPLQPKDTGTSITVPFRNPTLVHVADTVAAEAANQYCRDNGFRERGPEWHAYAQGWTRRPAAR